MSKRFKPACLFAGLCIALLVMGCSSASKPTPTPFVTETESVVVVVVTATTQPTLEATPVLEPTITPLATFTPVGLNSPTPTKLPTATRAPSKTATPETPAATAKPIVTTKPAATNTAPPPPPAQYAYPAPLVLGPAAGSLFNNGVGLQFQFESVGPLPTNVCYEIHVNMVNPNAPSSPQGDWWTWGCGDPSSAPAKVTFSLTRFTGQPYTYATIRDRAENLAPAEMLTVTWNVRVVQDNGVGPDAVHHNVTPLSPTAAGFDFMFKP